MTPQLFYNTGTDHLLDEHLNHLKNMKEDTGLNLLDALSAKQGKQVWCLNHSDNRARKRGKARRAYLGTGRVRELLTI